MRLQRGIIKETIIESISNTNIVLEIFVRTIMLFYVFSKSIFFYFVFQIIYIYKHNEQKYGKNAQSYGTLDELQLVD